MGTIKVTQEDFQKVVLSAEVPVVVDFWAEWCGPCRALAPKLEQIAKDYEGKIIVAKVNVEESAQVAEAHDVKALPTLIVFIKGKEQFRNIGNVSLQVMRTTIDKILAEPAAVDKKALESHATEIQKSLFEKATAELGKDTEFHLTVEKLSAAAKPFTDAMNAEAEPLKKQLDDKLISENDYAVQVGALMTRLSATEHLVEPASAFQQMMQLTAKMYSDILARLEKESD